MFRIFSVTSKNSFEHALNSYKQLYLFGSESYRKLYEVIHGIVVAIPSYPWLERSWPPVRYPNGPSAKNI
jgi:hypothetical protein